MTAGRDRPKSRRAEIWLHAFSFIGRVAPLAREAESSGYAGLLLGDSQSLNADVWIELALAAAATSRLRLGPGVTNLVTRHPAVTASAAATLQAESGGRAVLGVGRGDSAVRELGIPPTPVPRFQQALAELQRYLGKPGSGPGRPGDSTSDGDAPPNAAPLPWLAGGSAEDVAVAVHVAASGPATISAGARLAEAVDLAVGADPGRLRWGIERVRAEAGDAVSVGAFVNVAVHPDRARAQALVRTNVGILARFSGTGDPSADPRFVERFGVAGPAAEVRDRLAELSALGLARLIVLPCSLDAPADEMESSNRRFAGEVLPSLAS